jgi:HD superfamily phosphohydrolase
MNKSELRIVSYINDPIWGEVPLTALELDLIHTTAFRRLQHVRQMGFAYLGFPTANHRRYEHCLGAMHVAHLLSDIVSDAIDSGAVIDIEPAHYQAIRVAALLHDVGHAPYSHAFEEAVRKYPDIVSIRNREVFKEPALSFLEPLGTSGKYRHELFTKYIIQTDPEISSLLNAWAERSGAFPAHQIAALAVGEATYEGLAPFNPIISGDFDADRIDYVCRDSYYCGFSQRFRLEELRRNVVLARRKEEASYVIKLLEGSIPAVSTLLWYRYRLMKAVHLDRSNRIATQALVKALSGAFGSLFPDNSDQTDPKKLDLLLKFHTHMTDENCNEFLWEVTKTPLVLNLIKGELPEEVLAVSPRYLQPEEKAFLHFLLAEPRAVAEFDRRLDTHLGVDVFADIRMAKAPKFGTMVRDTEPGSPDRSVFDNYYTPHGIMIDSLNTLAIYLYHPNAEEFRVRVDELETPEGPEPFKFPMKPLRRAVYDAVLETYQSLRAEWEHQGLAFSLECWMSILHSVETLVFRTCKQRPWIAGDANCQAFIHAITQDVAAVVSISPSPKWSADDYSPDVFYDFEVLQHHGLVDHMHLPVGGPGVDQPWIGSRLDRRLSSFGRRYATRHLQGSWHYAEVFRAVEKRFSPVEDAVKELLHLQHELANVELFGRQRSGVYQQINEMRDTISQAGFVTVWAPS